MSVERIIPGTVNWEAWYANHIFRYDFALETLKKHACRKTLDAASGVGYGSYHLVTHGINKVVGVDINKETLEIGRKTYVHPDMKLLNDNCYQLSEAAKYGPYDSIVSCETIEHMEQPDVFLKRCHDLLDPEGVLFISTPNQDFSPGRAEIWDFHEKEFTARELKDLLQKNNFKDINLYGQSFSDIGILRQQIRAEFNKIHSNPFNRLGRWIQKTAKGHQPTAVLPEQYCDFVLTKEEDFETNIPFVLFATAIKA